MFLRSREFQQKEEKIKMFNKKTVVPDLYKMHSTSLILKAIIGRLIQIKHYIVNDKQIQHDERYVYQIN